MSEKRLSFDPTINLGHLVSLAGVIAAIIGGWYVFDYRLTALEKQVNAVSELIVQSVRLDEKMKAMDRRLDKLETKS